MKDKVEKFQYNVFCPVEGDHWSKSMFLLMELYKCRRGRYKNEKHWL